MLIIVINKSTARAVTRLLCLEGLRLQVPCGLVLVVKILRSIAYQINRINRAPVLGSLRGAGCWLVREKYNCCVFFLFYFCGFFFCNCYVAVWVGKEPEQLCQ